MKLTVEGSDRVALPPAQTAAALRDPAVLSRAVPGEGSVVRTGPGVATVTATAGIAGTRGTYRARVHVVEAVDERYMLRIAAAGEPGTIEAEVTVELHADDGGTRLDHRVTAALEGRLAGLGRKVLEGAVASGVSTFVAELEVAAGTPAAPQVGEPASSRTADTGAGAAAPGAGIAARGTGQVADAGAGGTGSMGVGASPVRMALTAAAAGALATLGALRWWHGRQDA